MEQRVRALEKGKAPSADQIELDLTAVFSMMEQNRLDLLETINPVTTIVEGLSARIDELEGRCKAQFVALDQDFDAQDTRISRYRLILNETVKTVILATLPRFSSG